MEPQLPRPLIVARRYWPVCDDAAMGWSDLAEGLQRQGFEVSIAACRLAAQWPAKLYHREVLVERPYMPPRGVWARSRHLKWMTKWLRDRADHWDILLAELTDEDLPALVEAAQAFNRPLLLRTPRRAYLASRREDRQPESLPRSALAASGYVVASAAGAQFLIAQGIAPRKVHRIEPGIPSLSRVTDQDRNTAARALASLSRDLTVAPRTRVIVFYGTLSRDSGIWNLMSASARLLNDCGDCRFIVVGEGPERLRLATEIQHSAMVGDFVLAGCFDHCDEILQVADCLVVTAEMDAWNHVLPRAIALGIPLVAADSVELRGYFSTEAARVRWFAPSDPAQLAAVLRERLADRAEAATDAEQLRLRMFARQSSAGMIEGWSRLIRDLVQAQSDRPATSSVGALR